MHHYCNSYCTFTEITLHTPSWYPCLSTVRDLDLRTQGRVKLLVPSPVHVLCCHGPLALCISPDSECACPDTLVKAKPQLLQFVLPAAADSRVLPKGTSGDDELLARSWHLSKTFNAHPGDGVGNSCSCHVMTVSNSILAKTTLL